MEKIPCCCIVYYHLYCYRLAVTLGWDKDLIPNNDSLLFIIFFYPPTALILGVSLHLWSEEQTNAKRSRFVHLLAQISWFLYCLIISQQAPADFNMELVIGLLATLFLFVSSIFFLSFIGKKNDIEAWNFGWHIIKGAFLSTVYLDDHHLHVYNQHLFVDDAST